MNTPVGKSMPVFGERYPVRIAGVGYRPLYDPQNLKPRS
jgi:hypothetical protein